MNLTAKTGFIALSALAIMAAPGCSRDAVQDGGLPEANQAGATAAGEVETASDKAGDVADAADTADAADAAAEVADDALVFADDEVIVEVLGKTLTYGEAIGRIKEVLSSQGLPADQADAAVKQIAPRALPQLAEEFVMLKLLQDAAAKEGLSVTDEEVDAKFEELKGSLPPGMTFEDALAQSGKTADQIKQDLRDTLPVQKLFEKVTAGCKATDEEIEKFYKDNASQFTTPEQVRASHILVSIKPGATDEDKAAAKAKLEGILAKLKDGGDFAALATEHSDCPSKSNGGDLDWFSRDRMVKPFADAAFALAEGEISGIVESEFGYHIIKKTGAREAGTVPLEEVRENIGRYLSGPKESEAVKTFIDGLREKTGFTQSDKLPKLFAEPEPEDDDEGGEDFEIEAEDGEDAPAEAEDAPAEAEDAPAEAEDTPAEAGTPVEGETPAAE